MKEYEFDNYQPLRDLRIDVTKRVWMPERDGHIDMKFVDGSKINVKYAYACLMKGYPFITFKLISKGNEILINTNDLVEIEVITEDK